MTRSLARALTGSVREFLPVIQRKHPQNNILSLLTSPATSLQITKKQELKKGFTLFKALTSVDQTL